RDRERGHRAGSLAQLWERVVVDRQLSRTWYLLDSLDDPVPTRRIDGIAHASRAQREKGILGRRLEDTARNTTRIVHRSGISLRHLPFEIGLRCCGQGARQLQRLVLRAGGGRRTLGPSVLDQNDTETNHLRRSRGELGAWVGRGGRKKCEKTAVDV